MRQLLERASVMGPRIEVVPGRSLRRYVGQRLFFEYPGRSLEGLPRHVALLPYVWAVAPIVWATGGQFEIDELEPTVAASLAAVRAELRLAYTSLEWRGEIRARNAAEPFHPAPGALREALLYSGGLDSTYSALRHAGRQLLLVSAWGIDIGLDEEQRWSEFYAGIAPVAERHAGGLQVVRTNVRSSFDYRRLNGISPDIARWWIDVQFGTTLTALAAPLAALHGIELIHLASGALWDDDKIIRNGSSPRLDNAIDFGFARAHHDGNDASRQHKLNWLVANGHAVPLRVCVGHRLRRPGELNCGACIKCLRTITGIVAAGGDPRAFGFGRDIKATLDQLPARFARRDFHFGWAEALMWEDIRDNRPGNVALDAGLGDWLTSFDFDAYGRADLGDATRSRALVRRLRGAVPWLAPLVAPLRNSRLLRRLLP